MIAMTRQQEKRWNKQGNQAISKYFPTNRVYTELRMRSKFDKNRDQNESNR